MTVILTASFTCRPFSFLEGKEEEEEEDEGGRGRTCPCRHWWVGVGVIFSSSFRDSGLAPRRSTFVAPKTLLSRKALC